MKKLTAIFCAALVAFSCGATAAEKTADGVTVTTNYAKTQQQINVTEGEITELEDNMATIVGQGYYDEVKVVLRQRTYIVSAVDGKTIKREQLAVGDKVSAYYGPEASRSLPPQVQAYALLVGATKKGSCIFYPVAKVKIVGDKATKGSYAVLMNTAGNLEATVTEFAYENYDEIEVGNNLLLWYELQTLSIPARTNATKVIVLPDK